MVWLELNKIGVWWYDWEVLEVVVEGAVGDVGGEGREGVLRGERAEVGDIILGGVPDVFCGIVVGGVGGHVDGRDAPWGPTGGCIGWSGPWRGGTWRCPGRPRSSFSHRSRAEDDPS